MLLVLSRGLIIGDVRRPAARSCPAASAKAREWELFSRRRRPSFIRRRHDRWRDSVLTRGRRNEGIAGETTAPRRAINRIYAFEGSRCSSGPLGRRMFGLSFRSRDPTSTSRVRGCSG